MRHRLFFTVLLSLLSLETLLASQVYLPQSPKVFETNTIFSLQEQNKIKMHLNVNVKNYTFQVSESFLNVSAERG